MSYTVIARRWRPGRFEDVIGQAHVVTTLKNSIKRGRIAHAYLFSGPRGVGKTSVSRILAKAVNCLEGVREEPCNACQTCKTIDSGGFVDVIEIDAASNRGIDEIRELRETVRYLPMQGRYKVYIIDEAHMLTEPAFNALLKTLEEPPGHNIFILATTESQKIPYTIMSRCQRFDFKRIAESQIVEQLRRILLDEQIEYDEAVLNYVVREADGSMRDAESLLDQVIAYSGKRITEKDVIDVIGVITREAAFGIVKCIVEKDAKAGLELIGRALEEGNDVYQIYKGLLSFLRDMLMIKVWNGKPPFVFMDNEEYEKTAALLKQVEYYEIQNMVHHMLKAEDLIRGIFPKISLEVLFINLYNLSQLRDVEKMLEAHAGKEARPAAPAPSPEKSEAPAPRREAAPPVFTPAPPVTPSYREPPPPREYPDDEPDDEEAFEAMPPPQAAAPSPAATFTAYLRENSKMLFGIFSSLDMTAEEDKLIVSLSKNAAFVKNDAAMTGELAKQASAFFGRPMAVRFVDESGTKVDTIDDYVKEAELLFKV